MNHHTQRNAGEARGSMYSYVVGFGLSILCTGIAFGLMQWNISQGLPIGRETMMTIIVVVALTQLLAQLIFFLHLGKGSDRNWNATVFAFAVLIVGIVVGGSLWIMSNERRAWRART